MAVVVSPAPAASVALSLMAAHAHGIVRPAVWFGVERQMRGSGKRAERPPPSRRYRQVHGLRERVCGKVRQAKVLPRLRL